MPGRNGIEGRRREHDEGHEAGSQPAAGCRPIAIIAADPFDTIGARLAPSGLAGGPLVRSARIFAAVRALAPCVQRMRGRRVVSYAGRGAIQAGCLLRSLEDLETKVGRRLGGGG